MRQPIGRDHDRGTRPTQELDEQEPDGTAAIDADSTARRDLTQVQGVQRDPERLEQGRLVVSDVVGQPSEQSDPATASSCAGHRRCR